MIKGDRIKLIKSMGVFTNVGEICDVVDVTTDGIISFKFGNGKHLGCMSYDEFEKYFELVESKRVWGNWVKYFMAVRCYNAEISIPAEVRTNKKIVQVRCKLPNDTYIKSQATCHKEDKFSFETGKHLAEKRLLAKMFVNEAKHFAARL